jgi:hypothetical protein
VRVCMCVCVCVCVCVFVCTCFGVRVCGCDLSSLTGIMPGKDEGVSRQFGGCIYAGAGTKAGVGAGADVAAVVAAVAGAGAANACVIIAWVHLLSCYILGG